MISWSDEAIEAAYRAYVKNYLREDDDAQLWRIILNAALAVQGCPKLPDCKTYADRAYADGYAGALVDAAKVAEDAPCQTSGDKRRADAIAAKIRALKEKQG